MKKLFFANYSTNYPTNVWQTSENSLYFFAWSLQTLYGLERKRKLWDNNCNLKTSSNHHSGSDGFKVFLVSQLGFSWTRQSWHPLQRFAHSSSTPLTHQVFISHTFLSPSDCIRTNPSKTDVNSIWNWVLLSDLCKLGSCLDLSDNGLTLPYLAVSDCLDVWTFPPTP